MSKKVFVEHEDELYTLEYTRKSIETLERQGFRIKDIESKPLTVLPQMFKGAFYANHKGIKSRVVDDIFDRIDDKSLLIEKLAAMYAEPIEVLFEGSDVASDKKISWEADF